MGPIPRHIALIMDGNRRYAQKNSMGRAEGHLRGFDKLAETLEWCLDLGITEVTVYAFSIENFKRSKEEVDCLMELARQKFARLMEEKETLQKNGICIRVLGNLALLPKDVQESIAEAMSFTKHNTRAVLNVCFAYTSREEMCHAIKEVSEGVQLGLIKESDINEELLEKCMYTYASKDPDLLIRTSGEVRLSDFLLWQSTFSVLSFVQVLWPDFSQWHLYAGILHYQRHHQGVQNARKANEVDKERLDRESDLCCVVNEVAAVKTNGQCRDSETIETKVEEYKRQRLQRVQNFLAHVQSKRDTFLEELCKLYIPPRTSVI